MSRPFTHFKVRQTKFGRLGPGVFVVEVFPEWTQRYNYVAGEKSGESFVERQRIFIQRAIEEALYKESS